MGHHGDVIKELRDPTIALRKEVPDTWRGFTDLHQHAVADGALPGSVNAPRAWDAFEEFAEDEPA